MTTFIDIRNASGASQKTPQTSELCKHRTLRCDDLVGFA